ncbi:hypothetical protein DPM13_01400 [Paracoccus mutanolyticus]|uniref:HMA domain-containing protein n=1 Tax=Paracoccus mutanolyticus TaxID=1499308 RepID=A0ABM6WP58_9RHOB|nr:hypothetical protein DPM13_01400 [Paracoccus mutanolyticus]
MQRFPAYRGMTCASCVGRVERALKAVPRRQAAQSGDREGQHHDERHG